MKKIFLGTLIFPLLLNAKGFVPNSFKAEFKEERIKVLTGKKVYSFGNIEYKYPGHLRFEVTKPKKSTLVINPDKTWYYNPPFIEGEKGELQVSSTKKNPIGKVFDYLKEGLKSNKQYKVEKKKEFFELVFSKESSKKIGVQKVELYFAGKSIFSNLNRIKIYYGKKTKTYILNSIKENLYLANQRFQFKAPANTNINNL